MKRACGWRAVVGILCLASAVVTRADENASRLRTIVDFADPQTFTLQPEQAEAKIVPGKMGPVLEITTEAKASWPGVNIFPRQGNWDLAGFDRVEMGVINPQQVPVKVLLNINNPCANGHEHCNVASVEVPAGKSMTLVVPFGTWHGDPTHPLDQKKIVR